MRLRKTLIGLFTMMLLLSFVFDSTSVFASEQSQADFSTEDLTDTTEEITIEEEMTEETVMSDEKAEEFAADQTTSKKNAKKQTSDKKAEKKLKAEKAKSKKLYTDKQLRLMSCIIFCEAGAEPYAGKLAVGIVVKNRMESSAYPDTISGVVYQPYQFTPARSGALSRALARYDAGGFTSANEKACIKAAKEALSGNKTVKVNKKEVNMKSYLFFSVYVSGCRLKIGGHMFK